MATIPEGRLCDNIPGGQSVGDYPRRTVFWQLSQKDDCVAKQKKFPGKKISIGGAWIKKIPRKISSFFDWAALILYFPTF